MGNDEQRLAKQLFIFDLKSFEQIAVALDIPIQTIREWAANDSWASLRDSARDNTLSSLSLSPRSSNGPETVSEDLLAEHEDLLGVVFRQIRVCLVQLGQDDTNHKALRGKVESLRSIAEALRGIIETHRTVRGIRSTAPSVATQTVDKGVRYNVVRPSAKQP